MGNHKAKNPKRVGSLEKDKPISLRVKTLKWGGKVLAFFRKPHEGRHGEGRVVWSEGEGPEGGKGSGELCTHNGLNRQDEWQTLAWG